MLFSNTTTNLTLSPPLPPDIANFCLTQVEQIVAFLSIVFLLLLLFSSLFLYSVLYSKSWITTTWAEILTQKERTGNVLQKGLKVLRVVRSKGCSKVCNADFHFAYLVSCVIWDLNRFQWNRIHMLNKCELKHTKKQNKTNKSFFLEYGIHRNIFFVRLFPNLLLFNRTMVVCPFNV